MSQRKSVSSSSVRTLVSSWFFRTFSMMWRAHDLLVRELSNDGVPVGVLVVLVPKGGARPLLKHDVATVAVPKPALKSAGETEALTLARVYEGSLEEASLG